MLTGETWAGKSILLDALGLGLALGRRAEARIVRDGAGEAALVAETILIFAIAYTIFQRQEIRA